MEASGFQAGFEKRRIASMVSEVWFCGLVILVTKDMQDPRP